MYPAFFMPTLNYYLTFNLNKYNICEAGAPGSPSNFAQNHLQMKIKALFGFFLILMTGTLLAQPGTIKGTVTDAESGETLIGVNVIIQNPFMGSNTDLNGHYEISHIAPGKYDIQFSYVSYAPQTIEGVEVLPGKELVLNVRMVPESMGLDEVVIKARKIDNTENAILAMQKRSLSVQDGISSQEMNRFGVSNAAQSVKKITGVSIVDGKHINVRGLGDRYSGAQLNGVTLNSTDPYSNSASLDLIPANMLEKVIASKTFTPDMPGNFTGGNVNLTTKSFPERRSFRVSVGSSYNTQSSFNPEFLSFNAGRYAFAGYNDGSLSLPTLLADKSVRNELSKDLYIKARRNESYANIIDQSIKSVSSQMAAIPKNSGANYNFSISYGNSFKLFGHDLGILIGGNAGRTLTHYVNGSQAAWDITGLEAQSLFPFFQLNDMRSVANPRINGLATLSYKMSDHHELGINLLYNHDAQISGRYQRGPAPGFLSASDAIFETRTLQFMERGLSSFQLRGKHFFPALGKLKMEWIGGMTHSYQNEPDLRFLANEIRDSLYLIRVSEYSLPAHFFRNLRDESKEFKLDLELPLSSNNSFNKFKFGVLANEKNRVFSEYRFDVNNANGALYNGNPEDYFASDNLGIIGYDSLRHRYISGLYLVNNTRASNNYQGNQQIYAGYAMFTYELFNKLKIAGGARLERTEINVQSEDSILQAGQIDENDLLPGINLIYPLTGKMNFRASVSRTIARPSMRELAPFSSFDYIGGFIYIGNPNLKRTLINNYDLRWEWFIRPGEVMAVSAFYKKFNDPISKFYNSEAYNPEIIYQNTSTAFVYGLELDFRKKLDFIHPRLKNFKLGSNFTYIVSRVDMEAQEYEILSTINPELKPYRPFQGQSPYIMNAMLSYDADSAGIHAMLSYNVFGPRLSEIGREGVPDIYERPRQMLNFKISKKVNTRFEFKVEAQNLLNAPYLKSQQFKGREYITESYQIGRTFNVGLSYILD